MMSQIELNMYMVNLHKRVAGLKEQLQTSKAQIYQAAYECGLEKVCSLNFQNFMDSFDKVCSLLEQIENKVSIKNNFTKEDYLQFISFVSLDIVKNKYME